MSKDDRMNDEITVFGTGGKVDRRYVSINDKQHADPIYKKMQRWCSNFIFWSVPTFEDYLGGKTENVR